MICNLGLLCLLLHRLLSRPNQPSPSTTQTPQTLARPFPTLRFRLLLPHVVVAAGKTGRQEDRTRQPLLQPNFFFPPGFLPKDSQLGFSRKTILVRTIPYLLEIYRVLEQVVSFLSLIKEIRQICNCNCNWPTQIYIYNGFDQSLATYTYMRTRNPHHSQTTQPTPGSFKIST